MATVFTSFGTICNDFSHGLEGVRVVTHDGAFHADEVTAVAILSLVGTTFHLARTRKQPIIDMADIVIDVGGEYDPTHERFDHHQAKGGIGGMAAAGLVWKHYGQVAVWELLGEEGRDTVDVVVAKVKEKVIDDIDRIDIGGRRPEKGEFTFSHYISSFNLPGKLNDPARFDMAVQAARLAVTNAIFTASAEATDELAVQAAINDLDEFDKVLVLDQYRFGMMNVCQLTNETREHKIERLVFPDVDGGSYRVQIVEGQRKLPEAWWGLRGGELSAAGATDGAVFVHPAGFIGGHSQLEGAILMALKN